MLTALPAPGQDAPHILDCFRLVHGERSRRRANPVLGRAVDTVKAWQQARFRRTYADLLASDRYGFAAAFFLDELYGPQDFSQRDAQFERVVPSLVKLFPAEIVRTVSLMACLHAVSEQLDSLMGAHLTEADGAWLGDPDFQIPPAVYGRLWRDTAHAPWRDQQIAWTVQLGTDLDRLTRKPLLRHTLKLMRGPARAAGLGALHQVMESGFDAFHSMKGAQEFLDTVRDRESALAARWFAGESPTR